MAVLFTHSSVNILKLVGEIATLTTTTPPPEKKVTTCHTVLDLCPWQVTSYLTFFTEFLNLRFDQYLKLKIKTCSK